MIPTIDFQIYSGDSRSITTIVTDSLNNPIDITDATIQFKVSKDSITLITKTTVSGIVITNASQGEFAINLSSSDTSSLLGNYDYQIRVTDSLNNSSIILTGQMVIKKSFS